jgi:hypothetical protein
MPNIDIRNRPGPGKNNNLGYVYIGNIKYGMIFDVPVDSINEINKSLDVLNRKKSNRASKLLAYRKLSTNKLRVIKDYSYNPDNAKSVGQLVMENYSKCFK